jgi:hypothetical protein
MDDIVTAAIAVATLGLPALRMFYPGALRVAAVRFVFGGAQVILGLMLYGVSLPDEVIMVGAPILVLLGLYNLWAGWRLRGRAGGHEAEL